MLKVFRDNLKHLSWILWGVIAVFVLFVFVDFGGLIGGPPGPSESAASVGDLDVSFGEFQALYRRTEDTYRQAYGENFSPELAKQLRLPVQVLDQLVTQKILIQEAERVGLQVTDDEIRGEILRQPFFQEAGGGFIGEERYRQLLRSNGLTAEQYEGSLRQDLLVQKLNSVLEDTLWVSDDEVEAAYREQVERAEIRYLQLRSADIKDEIPISDDEVRTYYDGHPERFRQPERRVADYLLLDAAQLRATLEIPQADIEAYYQEHAAEFAEEEQVHARHILLRVTDERPAEETERQLTEIRTRIESGADFAQLAGELSDDPGSAGRGGDLGFFGRGQMIQEFEQAAFSAQAGDLVGPIQTTYGFHLLEVLEHRPGGQRALEEVRAEIRNRLVNERIESAAETRVQELTAKVKAAEVTLENGLAGLQTGEPGVTYLVTEPFGREDTVAGIGRATAFTTTVFDLEPNGVSEAVKVPRGWVVAHLRDVQAPRLPAFEEVAADARQWVEEQRKVDLARARLAQARERVAAGATLDDVAADLGVTVQDSGEFGRAGTVAGLGRDLTVIDAALAMESGTLSEPIDLADGGLFFEVASRVNFEPARFETERSETLASVKAQRLNDLMATLVRDRREEIGVRYNAQLLENFGMLEGSGLPIS